MRKMLLLFVTTLVFVLLSSTATALDYSRKSVVGYFNGDAFLDRVISDPKNDTLYIWYGRGMGTGPDQALSTVPEWSMYSDYFPGDGDLDLDRGKGAPVSETITRSDLDSEALNGWTTALGSSMAVGDFNNDGLSDLAVGMPLATVNGKPAAGKVAIIYGGVKFPAHHRLVSQDTRRSWGRAEEGDQFGESLATGDFNCDGYDDLAIGVPMEDMGRIENAGVVHLFYGSFLGLYTNNHRLRESNIRGERQSPGDVFGQSLAAGRFNGEMCHSLAVGTPGEDINDHSNAGAVYVFYARNGSGLSHRRVQKIHQDSGLVGSIAESGDYFGSSLGSVLGNFDDLWIGAAFEDFPTCTDENQVFYHRLKGSATGIDVWAGDSTYCGLFPPDFVEKHFGRITEFNTSHGSIAFYFPDMDPAAMELSVLIQGSNAPPDDPHIACEANPIVYHRYATWITEAFNANEALIAPEFDNRNFGNIEECLNDPDGDGVNEHHYRTNGGFRYLWGNQILADEWVNLIVDDLQKVGFDTDGKFKLFGHSAGGQFVSRYLWKHAERTTRVIIESARSYLSDDIQTPWADGMTPFDGTERWPASPGLPELERPAFYDPGEMGGPEHRWPEIMRNPITIIVGEEDGHEVLSDGTTVDDCTRLHRALAWQEDLNQDYAGPYVSPSGDRFQALRIEYCVYTGEGHGARLMSDEAASILINGVTAGNCVTSPTIPVRCLGKAPYPYD